MAQEKAYKDQFSVEEVSEIAKIVNRYYQEVAITKIFGTCPYGYKEGEKFRVTSVNHDGLCGALYQAIHPCIASMHYGGGVVWEKDINVVGGVCPEMGRVQVEVKRFKKEPTHLKTKPAMKDMTGRGFPALDKYKVFVEILGIANKCMWGHRDGQRFEVDPFNVGGVCGFLYWEAYHFINLLFTGGSLPWEGEENVVHGACPDLYNQVSFRLVREKR